SDGPRQCHLCSSSLDSRHALPDLRDSLSSPLLLRYGPASHDRCPPRPKRKSSFGRESNHCVPAPLRELRLATQQMHHGGMIERKGQAEGVSKIAGQRESLVALRQRAVRIAKQPQDESQDGCGPDPRVLPVNKGVGAVNLWVVEMDSLLEVIASRREVSHEEERRPTDKVSLDEERRISSAFAQGKQLFRQLLR